MTEKYKVSEIFCKENYKSPELRKEIIEKILNKTIRKRSLLLKMNKYFVGTFSFAIIVAIGVIYYQNINFSKQQENYNNLAKNEVSTDSIEREQKQQKENQVRTLSMPSKKTTESKTEDNSQGMSTMSTMKTQDKKENKLKEEKIGTTSIQTHQEKEKKTSIFQKLWQDIKEIFSNLF